MKEIAEGVEFRHDLAFDPLGRGVDETLESIGLHKLRSGKMRKTICIRPKR